MAKYWGHSENGNGRGVRERLCTHIRAVSERASGFAAEFGAGEQARLGGLLHDLGKYADQFTRRIEDPNEAGRDHASVGAFVAAGCYGSLGAAPALAIEGHHTGLTELPWLESVDRRIATAMISNGEAYTSTEVPMLLDHFRSDGFDLPEVRAGLTPVGDFPAADMLDVRMLFSALVDADFLATEEHFAGDAVTPRRPRPEGPSLDAAKALKAVKSRLKLLRSEGAADAEVQSMRDTLAKACLEAGDWPQGVFTLSAPTGSGKTLAMLAFALRHAVRHGLRRIVLVMPFLNIIEQTATIYRSLFGREQGFPDHFVIEDHSNVHPPSEARASAADSRDERERLSRLLAENWDAPMVLTTSVQCLESLMANRPSACRKLHRLARSAILLDEVQTLPPHLAVPTLATLSRLCERFETSVLFATATQPAFDHLHEQVARLSVRGWKPREIAAPIHKRDFAIAAKRISVQWRTDEPVPWNTLVDQLAEHRQVLCIVNLKRHAKLLAELLATRGARALYHLSTNMCPAHRADVLRCVQLALRSDCLVRLVATQCVEAGVDLDFPVVYRALAPLEAIAQAGGRCNRHGVQPKPGIVRVFLPEAEGKALCPPGAYQQAADATRTFLRSLAHSADELDHIEILNAPERLRAYYRQFYALTGAAAMPRELHNALEAGDFAEVARHYRLIDAATINILVPYEAQSFHRLRDQIESTSPLTPAFIRDWIHRARLHAVTPYRPRPGAPIWSHVSPVQFSRRQVDNNQAEWFVALPGLSYSPLLGLEDPDEVLIF
jgi:CRISPR-associated endonuclease/helicase Cas3